MATTLFYLFIGLTAGNFAYQAFTKREWGKAAERSFFQGAALVGAYISITLR